MLFLKNIRHNEVKLSEELLLWRISTREEASRLILILMAVQVSRERETENQIRTTGTSMRSLCYTVKLASSLWILISLFKQGSRRDHYSTLDLIVSSGESMPRGKHVDRYRDEQLPIAMKTCRSATRSRLLCGKKGRIYHTFRSDETFIGKIVRVDTGKRLEVHQPTSPIFFLNLIDLVLRSIDLCSLWRHSLIRNTVTYENIRTLAI